MKLASGYEARYISGTIEAEEPDARFPTFAVNIGSNVGFEKVTQVRHVRKSRRANVSHFEGNETDVRLVLKGID